MSPATYYSTPITVTWDPPATYTGSITGYTVYMAISDDNGATWSQFWLKGTTTASVRTFITTPDENVLGRLIRAGVSCTAGGETSDIGTSINTVRCDYQPCNPPTSVSVSPTLSRLDATLSWSGASAPTGNSISGYQIYYSDSADAVTWGSWTFLKSVSSSATNGSTSVAINATQGSYRRYYVLTVSSLGSVYNSGYRISSNHVRTNIAPGAPSSFSASPSTYLNQSVTLTWGASSPGTSAISKYITNFRTSTDGGTTWSAWSTNVEYSSSARSAVVYPETQIGLRTQYRVWALDTLGSASSYITATVVCDFSPATAPTSCAVSAILAESNVTLSWAGASPGSGGPISGYQIQYSDSADGSTWGAWTDLQFYSTQSTSGTLSVSPPPTRGSYRRFRVRTEMTTGDAYSSPWTISSNSVRKNVLPTPPQVFTASPEIYTGTQVTISWSGVTPGTSPIKQYVVQQSISADNANWSPWETAATLAITATSGFWDMTASNIAGTYTRYRIAVTDTLNAMSSYVTSNSVYRNSPPLAPLVEAPKAGSVTYNPRPMYLIQTQPEPDRMDQAIWVYSAGGRWLNSVDDPECFTTPGATPLSVKTVFIEPDAANFGLHSVDIQCRDSVSAGATVSRSFTIEPSPFEEIIANETHVKADHIIVLRTAINNLRNFYNMAAYAWSYDITPGRTEVAYWPYHVLELRAALQGVVDKINSYDETTAEIKVAPIQWLDTGTGRPRADVMNQLMELVLQL